MRSRLEHVGHSSISEFVTWIEKTNPIGAAVRNMVLKQFIQPFRRAFVENYFNTEQQLPVNYRSVEATRNLFAFFGVGLLLYGVQ